MRKKDLLQRIVDLEGQTFDTEMFEATLARALADEQKDGGWVAMDRAGTKRNRSWGDVKSNLEECYAAWCVNPLAKSYTDYMRFFVIGRGTQITTDDGDDAQDRIKMFCELNEWNLLEKRICEELSRDGEVFVRYHDTNEFDKRATVSALTLVDPLEIPNIDCPKMDSPKRYQRVFTELGEMQDDGSQTSEQKTDWITASEVEHLKVNCSHNEIRGRSDLLVVLPWLRQLKRWIDDMSRRNYYIGAFNWMVECSGAIKPSTVTGRYPKGPQPGTVIAHTPSEKWSVNSPSLNWADSTEGARAIKLLVMAGYKMPESWFGDTGESNLATTQALAMPTLRAFLDRQDTLKHYFEKIISRGAGVEDVTVTFPEIVTEEAQSKATALNALSQALANLRMDDLLSKETAYEILRQFVDDLDEWAGDDSGPGEKKKIEAEDQEETIATAQGRKLAGKSRLVRPEVAGEGAPPIPEVPPGNPAAS